MDAMVASNVNVQNGLGLQNSFGNNGARSGRNSCTPSYADSDTGAANYGKGYLFCN